MEAYPQKGMMSPPKRSRTDLQKVLQAQLGRNSPAPITSSTTTTSTDHIPPPPPPPPPPLQKFDLMSPSKSRGGGGGIRPSMSGKGSFPERRSGAGLSPDPATIRSSTVTRPSSTAHPARRSHTPANLLSPAGAAHSSLRTASPRTQIVSPPTLPTPLSNPPMSPAGNIPKARVIAPIGVEAMTEPIEAALPRARQPTAEVKVEVKVERAAVVSPVLLGPLDFSSLPAAKLPRAFPMIPVVPVIPVVVPPLDLSPVVQVASRSPSFGSVSPPALRGLSASPSALPVVPAPALAEAAMLPAIPTVSSSVHIPVISPISPVSVSPVGSPRGCSIRGASPPPMTAGGAAAAVAAAEEAREVLIEDAARHAALQAEVATRLLQDTIAAEGVLQATATTAAAADGIVQERQARYEDLSSTISALERQIHERRYDLCIKRKALHPDRPNCSTEDMQLELKRRSIAIDSAEEACGKAVASALQAKLASEALRQRCADASDERAIKELAMREAEQGVHRAAKSVELLQARLTASTDRNAACQAVLVENKRREAHSRHKTFAADTALVASALSPGSPKLSY